MNKHDCTILILSCDKYADLWKPFFMLFRKHWPDCPYPVVLGSNTVTYKDLKVETLLSGPDKDWSTSFRSILQQIETPYVFLWLDDIFPIGPVDGKRFALALEFMKKHKAKYVHGAPNPAPDLVMENDTYGVYERGAPYRVTTFGFWEVNALKAILLSGEGPWKFEIMGSYRSSYTDGFYCTMQLLFKRLHVVEKGRIFQDAYEYCQRHGIPLSVSHRPLLGSAFHLKSEIQKVYFNTMIRIPWKIRVRLMDILRRMIISY